MTGALTTWRRGALALTAVALLAAATSATADSGYYRWTNDAGKVQFTQQPPAGRPYQFIRTSTGTAEQAAAEAATEANKAEAATPAEPTSMEVVADKDPAKCEQARNNMAVLSGKARIRSKGEDGEYRYLTPEEIEEQRNRAVEAAEVFCE